MSSTNSVDSTVRSLSISSNIQNMMEKIITTIKDLVASSSDVDLNKLNRLLYRSMDNLKEFELELRVLLASMHSNPTPSKKTQE